MCRKCVGKVWASVKAVTGSLIVRRKGQGNSLRKYDLMEAASLYGLITFGLIMTAFEVHSLSAEGGKQQDYKLRGNKAFSTELCGDGGEAQWSHASNLSEEECGQFVFHIWKECS